MKKTKDGLWRITVRLDGKLKANVERIAKKKRWSVNSYIEESIIEKVSNDESLSTQ